jgi:hypothetical protein
MAYELVKSIRKCIEQGIGDIPRLRYILDRLEKGKDLYFSDKKYLESLLYTSDESPAETGTETENITDLQSLETLETDLKNLNAKLENILKNKQRTEKIKPDQDESTAQPAPRIEQKPKPVDEKAPVRRKKEDVTLLLAVVLGLVSLQGIGHIYIGKIARGAGILVLSLLLTAICVTYVVGIMPKSSLLSSASIYLLPVFIVGYLGLFIFQVLDSRKLCAEYNKYVSEQGTRPPWW